VRLDARARTGPVDMPGRVATPMRLRPERPWREHEGLYRDLFADPAVATPLWPGSLGGVRSERQAGEILAADVHHWEALSFGPWVFFETASGMFVGRGGLRRCKVAGSDSVEVLYAVRSEAWGEGYASEIASVSVAQARRLGLTEIVGFTATTNRASQRVLEKIGIRFDDVFQYAGVPHLFGRLVIS
jgi:[ribosomal protein S5]-alanine N-acetyltransferase